MIMYLLWLISFVCSELINTTDTFDVDTSALKEYEIDVGADGVVINLKNAGALTLKGVQKDPSKLISIVLQFDDDDYHNQPFALEIANLKITFACNDPIVFSINQLKATNCDFGSTKTVHAHFTSSSEAHLDYVSFVNAFGPGAPLAGTTTDDETGLYSNHNTEMKVALPDNVAEITFSDASFYIELETGEKDSFSLVLYKNFQIILISPEDKDEIILDAKAAQIFGNITIIAEKAILNSTDDFLQVTSSKGPISVCCEIIILPYETVPSGVFKFITSEFEETTDQVVMTKGVRSYCLYDTTKCDVYGYIPLKVESTQYTIPAGKSMSYVLSTSSPLQFHVAKTSASSVMINGTTSMRQLALVIQDSSSLTDNFTLDNVEISAGGSLVLKNLYIGANVVIKETPQLKLSVSESFNSSFAWYLTNIHKDGHLIELEVQPVAKICLYDFNNITTFTTTSTELKIQYSTSPEDVLTFPTASNNRVIIYTNDENFSIDPAGATDSLYGNFELHVILQFGHHVEIEFPKDWANVQTVSGGPIGVYVHTNSYSKKNIIVMPFNEFPAGFIEFDDSIFTTYSTINTSLCLYNVGQTQCNPVPGGHAVEIPSSGEITIESGVRYVYTADDSVTIPPDLRFVATQTSARNLGFNFKGQTTLSLLNDQLDSLDITDVNITVVINNSNVLTVRDYYNNDADLYIDNSDYSTADGTITVTNSMEITSNELQRFFSDGWNQFTGKALTLNDDHLLQAVRFTTSEWHLSIAESNITASIPNAGMNFVIKSSSANVSFDVPDGAFNIRPLTFISMKANTIVYFDKSWTDFGVNLEKPIEIDCDDNVCQEVSFYHPFAYFDERVDKIVTLHPHIIDCPYQNASICLSTNSSETCGLEGYYIPQVISASDVYTVPPGYHFQIYVASDSLHVTYDSKSAKNFTIQGFLASGTTQRPAILSLASTTPTDSMIVLNDLNLTINVDSSYQWKVAYLDLFDTTFTSSQTISLSVSKDFSSEMDIFYQMTKTDGVFADGRLNVTGKTTLRDSNEEYLNEIKLGTDKWTLSLTKDGTPLEFTVSKNQFSNLVFGVNRPPQELPKIIPLTLETGITTVAGGLDINIEEEFLYLQISSEWKSVTRVSGDTIKIKATHGHGISRFLFNTDCDVVLSRVFSIDSQTVHLLNNETGPICLLPSQSFVDKCYYHSMDMIPIISSDLEYLLGEERKYVVFAKGDEQYNFKYRDDEHYYSVEVYAANSITILMDNAPKTVNLHFDSLIDDDGLCTLIFSKSMTLLSLRFDDSVRIQTTADDFKLTLLDDLILDYKSFRRFFRSPGIFTNPDSLELTNGVISINDDTGRYNEITLRTGSWVLNGNQDAWNTTFEQRGNKQSLHINTSNPNILVKATDSEVVSISLTMTTHYTQIHLDETICDIDSFVDGNISYFVSSQACTIYNSYKNYLPDLFQLKGSFTQTYVEPTAEYSICLYPRDSDPCKIPGTQPYPFSVDQDGFRIRCAKVCKIYISSPNTMMNFRETSAKNLYISGDVNKTATLIMEEPAESTINDLTLEVNRCLLSITAKDTKPSFANVKLNDCLLEMQHDLNISKSFETDIASLQRLTNTINVNGPMTINVQSANLPTTAVGPKIKVSDQSSVTLGDMGILFTRFDFGTDSTGKNKIVFQTANDVSKSFKLTLLNLPSSLTSKFTFADSKDVYMNWVGQTNINLLPLPAFSYVFGRSSSLTISASSRTTWPIDYSLSLSSPTDSLQLIALSAVSLEIPNSYVKLNYDTIKNIRDLSSLRSTNLQIDCSSSITQIHLDSSTVQINDYVINRGTGKTFEVLHTSKSTNLTIGRLGSTTSIIDTTVPMKSGTIALIRKGFINVKSGKLVFKKSDTGSEPTTVYVHDSSIPSVISGDKEIKFVIDQQDDDDSDGKSKGLPAGAIVGIVFLIIAIAATAVGGYVYYRKKHPKLNMTDYDYAPPLLSSKEDNKELDSFTGEKNTLKL